MENLAPFVVDVASDPENFWKKENPAKTASVSIRASRIASFPFQIWRP
jgi:hypothetical protein